MYLLSVYLFSQMPFKKKISLVFKFAKSNKIREVCENIHTRKKQPIERNVPGKKNLGFLKII